jgi:hypothetical protein
MQGPKCGKRLTTQLLVLITRAVVRYGVAKKLGILLRASGLEIRIQHLQ